MDLIGQLASQIGIDKATAETLAGALLGGVTDQVKAQVGKAEAQQIEQAIPEMSDWQQTATTALQTGAATDGGPDLGGLLGSALKSIGGEEAGGLLGALTGATSTQGGMDAMAVANLLGKLNINPAMASAVAPLILNFLKERLSPELVTKLVSAIPLLTALSSGGLADTLGGLLGGLNKPS